MKTCDYPIQKLSVCNSDHPNQWRVYIKRCGKFATMILHENDINLMHLCPVHARQVLGPLQEEYDDGRTTISDDE